MKNNRTKRKSAFTFRIDAERHVLLRTAVILTGRSAQHLMTDALDHLLAATPGVDALASRLAEQDGGR